MSTPAMQPDGIRSLEELSLYQLINHYNPKEIAQLPEANQELICKLFQEAFQQLESDCTAALDGKSFHPLASSGFTGGPFTEFEELKAAIDKAFAETGPVNEKLPILVDKIQQLKIFKESLNDREDLRSGNPLFAP